MSLRPRHYILIAVIVALGIYNFARLRHPRRTPGALAPARAALPTGPRPESAAWNSFDRAAALRDAPDTQFSPALSAFHDNSSRNSSSDPDLSGCSTWLEFYRQGVLHRSRDPAWHLRSNEHLDSCVKYHRDIAS